MNPIALAQIGRRFNITRPLVCLDVETTGVVPGVDRVIQLAVQKVLPGAELVSEWSRFIDPQLAIPMEATHVHKITNEMVAGAPTFAELAGPLSAGLADVDFVGQNVLFDLRFLAAEFARVGRAWSYEGARIIDTHRMDQVLDPRDLASLVRKHLGLEMTNAHDAMADVQWTSSLLAGLFEKFPELPQNLDALHALLWPRDPSWVDAAGKVVWRNGDACLGFGKYNGIPLKRVVHEDRRYLRDFILGKDFPADVKAIIRDAIDGKFPIRALAQEAA